MNFISKTIRCLFAPLLALLLCAFGTDSAVYAVPRIPVKAAASEVCKAEPNAASNAASLAEIAVRLQQLGRGVKDPKARALIKDVVTQAGQIDKAGAEVAIQTVQDALDPVDKALDYFTPNASKGCKGCDVCSELSEIDCEIKQCCTEIKALIINILELLQAGPPCGEVSTISTVPFTASHPGKYCVTADLTYGGTGAAITIAASNVTLNFHDHSLKLTGGGTGILAQHVKEFVCENDLIYADPPSGLPTSIAVQLTGVQKATLHNIYTMGTHVGVQIDTSSEDVVIKNGFMQAHDRTGVRIDASTAIYIDGCTFDGADLGTSQIGLLVLNGSKNVSVTNSTFTGWDGSLLAAGNSTGMLVDNCQVVGSIDATYVNLVGLGNTMGPANDVILRNSTFTYSGSVPGADGLRFYSGDGLLLENIIVDTNTSYTFPGYYPAAIHIGCGADFAGSSPCGCSPVSYSNILARNCIVTGTNWICLLVDAGQNITFANSQFTNASVAGVALDVFASLCTITDSTMSDNTYGVYISGNVPISCNACAENNAIVRNLISGNNIGIALIPCCPTNPNGNTNLLTDNRIFDNTNQGIYNTDPNAQIWFNTSVNPGAIADCIGVSPFVTQVPGASPVVVGSNICGISMTGPTCP